MSDTAPIARRYPLDEAGARHAAGPTASLKATEPAARLSFFTRSEAARQAIGAAFGLALPHEPCRFSGQDGCTAVWLGPDEWLLIAPGEDGPALFASLSQALGSHASSLVDVSERSVGIEVAGPMAAALINAGCPLDLSLQACPVGFASRTVLGKCEIVLMRLDEQRFAIDVWRSFAPYVFGYLEEARRDFAA